MKTFRVDYGIWNGYRCGCCSHTSYDYNIYEAVSFEQFLKDFKKIAYRKYLENNDPDNSDSIYSVSKISELTNCYKTTTIIDESLYEKELELLEKKAKIVFQKIEKRNRKEQIRRAIKQTERKIQENSLQKELDELKKQLNDLK